jgi:hypothetical protein
VLERAKGIEPSYAAWEAAVLPLNYARGFSTLYHSAAKSSTQDPCYQTMHLRTTLLGGGGDRATGQFMPARRL